MEIRAQTNVLIWHNDNFRTGANLYEPILTPANVTPSSFGKLFEVTVDGKVDAQPLYVSALSMPGTSGIHNAVYVATEHDSLYAFDADTGSVFWKVSLLPPGETTSDSRNCGQVIPEIGITSTPVIDLSAGPHGTIYAVAMSKEASGNYFQRLHALDLTTGAEEFGGPTLVQATYPGDGANSQNGNVVFDAGQYKDRAALTLLNGIVYTSWGSHCDIYPYTGWAIGYDRMTLQQNGVFNFAPNGGEAALWNSGAGPAVDDQGNLFFAVANGTFDPAMDGRGFPVTGNYGNSFVKLTATGGKLVPLDYWAMYNAVSESNQDSDLGSGGVMLLPDLQDAAGKTVRLAVGAGKDSNLYVVDRDNMGKFSAASNSTIHQVLTGALPGGIFSSPTYFNGKVYFGAVDDRIRSFQVMNGLLSTTPVSMTAGTFGYPGATPSISAKGTADAILWAVENGNTAVLHAYDAANLTTELYNSNMASASRDALGPGNKYIVPTIANGKVFVGTTNSVAVFGLLAPQVVPNGTYILTNQASKLVLDVWVNRFFYKVQPVQRSLSGGESQKWILIANSSGDYTIRNALTGFYLADPGSTASRVSDLQQQPPNGSDAQLWTLKTSGSGYTVQNKATGLLMKDPSFSQNAGTGIVLSPLGHGPNQVWTIQEFQGAIQ